MTPSGTRTRSMRIPFGRVHESVTVPTGSGNRCTTSTPAAIASMRFPSSARRSTNASVAPAARASARSPALAARICLLPARIAFAIAASAASFCAGGASASVRAAAFARAPISRITSAMSRPSIDFSGAVMQVPPANACWLTGSRERRLPLPDGERAGVSGIGPCSLVQAS